MKFLWRDFILSYFAMIINVKNIILIQMSLITVTSSNALDRFDVTILFNEALRFQTLMI